MLPKNTLTLLEDMSLAEVLAEIQQINSMHELNAFKTKWFGSSGRMTNEMKALSALPIEQKKVQGVALNKYKAELLAAIEQRRQLLELAEINSKLAAEAVDITLPVRTTVGKFHPLSRTTQEIIAIFTKIGFNVGDGNDIESEYYNFTALNIPPHHPARNLQDTFYFDDDVSLLRTHTSPTQIHIMQTQPLPIKVIVPGRVYRADHDQTHTPMFHQVEGMLIDKRVTMGHLKWCLEYFIQQIFADHNANQQLSVRFRPSFFPFTEPSAEVDFSFDQQKWLEVLGCGMIHPNVLRECNIDPNEYSGFAFGMGVERIAMLKYQVADIRSFFDNDQRWLEYYGTAAGF